jgi:hypothetical protein
MGGLATITIIAKSFRHNETQYTKTPKNLFDLGSKMKSKRISADRVHAIVSWKPLR